MKLTLQKITKKIEDKIILSELSLNAYAGDLLIILGKSGEGKSTLLKIISGLDNTYSGNILINDIIQKKGMIIRCIGLIFQEFHLWQNYSVIENITMPLEVVDGIQKEHALQKAMNILSEYGLLEHKNKKIAQLSGGQKQRLAIARAVAMEARIICFDEPFSALDPYLTSYIIQKIKELQARGYIIILTTHNVHILSQFNGIIHFLHKGKIQETRITENICKNNEEKDSLIMQFIRGVVD